MGVFTSFIEVLPHAKNLLKGPASKQFLRREDCREWQVHTTRCMCGTVLMGEKVPDYMRDLFNGEHVVRDFFYDLDKKFGGNKVGWLIFKDNVFLGVEVVKENDEEEERDYPEQLIKEKYGIANPVFHYNWVETEEESKRKAELYSKKTDDVKSTSIGFPLIRNVFSKFEDVIKVEKLCE